MARDGQARVTTRGLDHESYAAQRRARRGEGSASGFVILEGPSGRVIIGVDPGLGESQNFVISRAEMTAARVRAGRKQP